tara:strand:+ start:296 stop:406 length:111 start_codon:yes stop_codon:yes gene_type:complete
VAALVAEQRQAVAGLGVIGRLYLGNLLVVARLLKVG